MEDRKNEIRFETGHFRHIVLTVSMPTPWGSNPGNLVEEGAIVLRFKQAGWKVVGRSDGGKKRTLVLESPACRTSREDEAEKCLGEARGMARLYGLAVESEEEKDGCGSNVFSPDCNVPARWAMLGNVRTLHAAPAGDGFAFVAHAPVIMTDGNRPFLIGYVGRDGNYRICPGIFPAREPEDAYREMNRIFMEENDG